MNGALQQTTFWRNVQKTKIRNINHDLFLLIKCEYHDQNHVSQTKAESTIWKKWFFLQNHPFFCVASQLHMQSKTANLQQIINYHYDLCSTEKKMKLKKIRK